MQSTPIVVESQPDWLTATTHTDEQRGYLALVADAIAVSESAHGDRNMPFRLLGFEGWRCGRVRWGERGGLGLLQLSGELAYTWFNDVVAHAARISRVDLAVTVDMGEDNLALGEGVYQQALEHRFEHPRSPLPWFVGDAEGGWTTYLGKRESDWFLRCYNKHAEAIAAHDDVAAGQYERCWRFELEVKGHPGNVLAHELYNTLSQQRFCRRFVHGWLEDHGIAAPWTAEGDNAKISPLRRRSDRDVKVAWLRSKVAPSVRWLAREMDREELLEVLGLADPESDVGP